MIEIQVYFDLPDDLLLLCCHGLTATMWPIPHE
jgi:hypothetical protein